jgi:hypothetical protein
MTELQIEHVKEMAVGRYLSLIRRLDVEVWWFFGLKGTLKE